MSADSLFSLGLPEWCWEEFWIWSFCLRGHLHILENRFAHVLRRDTTWTGINKFFLDGTACVCTHDVQFLSAVWNKQRPSVGKMIICHFGSIFLGACLYVCASFILMENAQRCQMKCSVNLHGMAHVKEETGILLCVMVMHRKKICNNWHIAETKAQIGELGYLDTQMWLVGVAES